MTDWIMWFGLAGLLVILEMFTGTFYLLMISLGLLSGSMAAWMGASVAVQFVIAAVVGLLATFILSRTKLGKFHKTNAARDPNVNLDIGQSIVVEQWKTSMGSDTHTARVLYRGAMWDVELAQGGIAEAGPFIIREIRGSHLIVSNNK